MATTPTNKPIPSEDPRDLKFNAGKIDEEVNGSSDYYIDRFGAQRLTNTGRNNQFQDSQTQREYDFQQFLLNSGYQFLGDYENGPYTIDARNQIIRYQNEFWRLNASTMPPYTTTGINVTSWAIDVTHLVSVGDAALRTELASVNGAAFSLSQVATAYGLDFSLGGVWSEGLSSTADNWWWYNNDVYTGFIGTLPTTPSAPGWRVSNSRDIELSDHFAISSTDNSTDNLAAINSAIARAIETGKRLHIPSGTYYVSGPIDCTGGTVNIYGDGVESTFIVANATFTGEDVFNMYYTEDNIRRSSQLSSITVDADSKANYGVRIRYVHSGGGLINCRVVSALVANLYTKGDWLASYRNCGFTPAPASSVILGGENNRVIFDSCGFASNSSGTYAFYADGNIEGLTLLNCDMEFGIGKGYYLNTVNTNIVGGYHGEAIVGDIFTIQDGTVNISGARCFYGFNSAAVNNLFSLANDACVRVSSTAIADQGYAALSRIAASSDARTSIKFEDCYIGSTVSGVQVMVGDPLAYGPLKTYASTRPILYTLSNTGNTVTRTRSNNYGVTINCTAVSGTSKISLNTPVTNRGWKVNDRFYCLVTYSSNVDVDMYLSGTVYAASSATLIGTLPSTSGVLSTAYIASNFIPENTSEIIEFYINNANVGNSFTIKDVTITDRARTFNGTTMVNLFKAE